MLESAIILSNREKARNRINVYHDSSNNWLNIIKELVGNSLDVFDDQRHNIYLQILSNEEVIYVDDGPGIPVEVESSNGELNYIALFEVDFAGTKYGFKNTTVGQNGVFLWTLAMTCESIVFEIGRPNGNIYEVAYKEGYRVKDMSIIGSTTSTYTKIHFKIDNKVWNKPNFTYSNILEIVKAQAALKNNVTIHLSDHENTIDIYYESTMDYFKEMTEVKNMICKNIYLEKMVKEQLTKTNINGYVENVDDTLSIKLIFGYSNDNQTDFKKDFLNTADLIKYGTINEGILYGIKSVANKYLKSNGKYNKNEKQITLDDVNTGLNYIADVRSFYVEYVGQSKQRTESAHYKTALLRMLEDTLTVFFIENKEEAEKICNQILLNKRVREKSDVDRSKYRKILEAKSNNVFTRPEKFIDCRSKNPIERKLIIIEGDSALNIIKSSRNANNTCIYPLKGKPLNPLKCNIDRILANQEIMDIYRILGCGLTFKGKAVKGLPEFNINNLNVNEVLIMTDADVDGSHIKSLMITLFYMLSPQLIEQGKIYILESPLYIIKWNGEEKWVYSETEYETISSDLKTSSQTRYKGLGGLQPIVMSKVLSDEYRKIKRISFGDVQKSVEAINLFMANETLNKRKRYIEENLSEYITDAILEG